jgi:hypothetical protein
LNSTAIEIAHLFVSETSAASPDFDHQPHNRVEMTAAASSTRLLSTCYYLALLCLLRRRSIFTGNSDRLLQ